MLSSHWQKRWNKTREEYNTSSHILTQSCLVIRHLMRSSWNLAEHLKIFSGTVRKRQQPSSFLCPQIKGSCDDRDRQQRRKVCFVRPSLLSWQFWSLCTARLPPSVFIITFSFHTIIPQWWFSLLILSAVSDALKTFLLSVYICFVCWDVHLIGSFSSLDCIS